MTQKKTLGLCENNSVKIYLPTLELIGYFGKAYAYPSKHKYS